MRSASRNGGSARKRGSNAGKNAESLKFKGRFSSAASLQNALNLNRKHAFDDETQMMEEDTTEGGASFMTSTTDYLRGGKEAHSRNLDNTSISSEEERPRSTRGKDPSVRHSLSTSKSQDAREKKRLQEREWQRDRQRRATAEPTGRSKSRSTSKRRSYDSGGFQMDTAYEMEHGYGSQSDDETASDIADDGSNIYENKFQPRSSRQLGSTPMTKNTMARDGYDSDSYSLKKTNRQKLRSSSRVAPAPRRRNDDMDDSYANSSRPRQSLVEDSTNMEDSMVFAPSTVKTDANSTDSFLQESTGKIKMTKMDKIKQLQAKNDRYKEEYKKTYLEKKEVKKKYEDKKLEVASLTSDVESYMKETALLKKQLHQLTSEMDHAENGSRKDMAMVVKLQKELKETRADLKEALGRIADRKMEKGQLSEMMQRKDDQIESLTLEVSQQIEEVQRLQAQMSIQGIISSPSGTLSGHGQDQDQDQDQEIEEKMEELKEENDNVKAELAMTLNRAAEMVKNREGTIEILRKENVELKELLDIRDQDDERTTVIDRIQQRESTIEQLHMELAGLKELQDQSAGDKESLKGAIKEREAELKNLKVDVDGLKKMVKRAEKDSQKAWRQVDDREITIATLTKDVQGLKSAGKEAAREVEECHKLVEARDLEIHELQDKIRDLRETQDGSCERLGDARATLEEKEDALKSLYRENENLKADLLKQRERLDERRKAAVLELEEMKLQEKELRDQRDESKGQVRQRDEAIEDLLKEVERLKKNHGNKESDYTEELKIHERKMEEMLKDMEEHKSQMQEKDQELERTRGMVKEREDAIEDLLRDIEGLKQDGSDLEKRVNTRTSKLNQQIKDQEENVENLRGEVESLTNRLDEAQKKLESETHTLQERDEEIDELLEEVSELKLQNETLRKDEASSKAGPDPEELQRELKKAKDLIKGTEEKFRRIRHENAELKGNLEKMEAAKESIERKKDDTSEGGDDKSYLIAQHEVLEEEIQQLNDQVNELQEELDEVHRQNSILNEEVEDWHQRGGNFELEIQRLRNEIEGWEDKADQLRTAAEGLGKDDMGSASDNSSGMGDRQAMMLEKAMAERKRKESGQGKGVWGLLFNQSEDTEELTEEQKRIRELETIKDAQAEELQKVKSDLVRLTTGSRNDSYVSKKKIADLEEENDGYKAKVELLLRRLAEVQGVPYGDDSDNDDEKKMEDPPSGAETSVFHMNLLA